MRTTVVLPDDTFRQLKVLAAQRGTTLKQQLRTAVENELERKDTPAMKGRMEFPILDSKEPGTLNLSNADIEELLA